MIIRILKYILLSLLIWLFVAVPARSQEYVGGLISEDAVFSPALNPYVVIETLIVPQGVTLTILPGTTMNFMIRTSLRIEGGTLVAMGTPDNPIILDAHNPSGDDDKKWDGISFLHATTETGPGGEYTGGSFLNYVQISRTTTGLALSDTSYIHAPEISIRNSDYGIYLQSGATLVLRNSVVDACSYGMYIRNSGNNEINGCQITNCDIGIFFPSNNVSRNNRIINNNLSNNRNIGLFMSIGQNDIQFNTISNNTVAYNNIGLHIGNGGAGDIGFNRISGNLIRYNDIGLKLSQDADTVSGNLIELNGTGLSLNRASANSITGNTIRSNSDWGVLLTDGSNDNRIEENSICSNSAGIKVTHKDFRFSINNSFEKNTIAGNLAEAFYFESGPQSGVHFNSISGIRDTAVFVNRWFQDVQATSNWWHTTDTTVINQLIYDVFDNSDLGRVIYQPLLGAPDPQAPISAPGMVVKRQVGQQVLVNWNSNTEADLAGYKVYFGWNPDGGFLNRIDIGMDTLVILEGLVLEDVIAVTAYDLDADDTNDQMEGHESAYAFAIPGPYAGGSTVICEDEVFFTASATASGYLSLEWTTSGDGTFLNPNLLITQYVPGSADIETGTVSLYLQITTASYVMTDRLDVQIMGQPVVFAGNDTIVSPVGGFHAATAVATNYTSLFWTSSGDGMFENAGQLNTRYIPGQADQNAGFVILTLHLVSECGNVSDDITLTVRPSFSISGTVRHGQTMIPGGVVLALGKDDSGTRAVMSTFTDDLGSFSFDDLSTGYYYLYALSSPDLYPGRVPSYYARGPFWQNAYLLPLTTDVYDVDIELSDVDAVLPDGPGHISGVFVNQGEPGRDSEIFLNPWFGNFLQADDLPYTPAVNHVVLLMNPSVNKILGWALTGSDGSFLFPELPYGSYRLLGEKAGYSSSISPLITLSPEHPGSEDVLLSLDLYKIDISVPDPGSAVVSTGIIYPNPASDFFRFVLPGSDPTIPVMLELYDMKGVCVLTRTSFPHESGSVPIVDISSVQPGVYQCVLTEGTARRYVTRLIISR